MKKYLESEETQEAVNTIKQLDLPNKLLAEMISYLMVHTLEKSDENRDSVSKLIIKLKDAGIINSDNFMEVSFHQFCLMFQIISKKNWSEDEV